MGAKETILSRIVFTVIDNKSKDVTKIIKKDITFVRLACSGHAIPEDLDKIIALIEPQVLVPIHTLKPEKLENPYGERILPERG